MRLTRRTCDGADEHYKGLGKPDKFTGKETDWLDWKFTFCS